MGRGDDWFTEAGATGKLPIRRRGDDWYVAVSTGVGETVCVVPDSVPIDPQRTEQMIDVSVSKFRRSTGDGPNFLWVEPNEAGDGGGSNGEDVADGNEEWDLEDFYGSGEYVDVVATVDAIHWVREDDPGTPKLKGELTDDSLVVETVYFVVSGGASHPFFEEGDRYRFEKVKDHHYRERDEVQVMITDDTTVSTVE
jgi:hypothetical protein